MCIYLFKICTLLNATANKSVKALGIMELRIDTLYYHRSQHLKPHPWNQN